MQTIHCFLSILDKLAKCHFFYPPGFMELVVKTYPGGKVSGFMDRLKVKAFIASVGKVFRDGYLSLTNFSSPSEEHIIHY